MDSSPFAKISAELRLSIYEFVFRQTHQIRIVQSAHHYLHDNEYNLQPRQLKDAKIWLRSQFQPPVQRRLLAITQSCKQIRQEALSVFYEVNDFYVEQLSPFEYQHRYMKPDQYPALTLPLVKFLSSVERQCSSAYSKLPSMKIEMFIGGLGLIDVEAIGLAQEDPVQFILATLLELHKACINKGWKVDFMLKSGFHIDELRYIDSDNLGGRQILIRKGFKCLQRLIKESEVVSNGFVRDTKVLRRWQQVFVS